MSSRPSMDSLICDPFFPLFSTSFTPLWAVCGRVFKRSFVKKGRNKIAIRKLI